ncbi:MAG: HNH endonuclease [Methanobacteriota archaeon]
MSDSLSDITRLNNKLRKICQNDPAVHLTFLGTESYLVAFLEFLFFRAEGPYSPGFIAYAECIRLVFTSSESLCILLDHNAADAIGNMVLNKRGKLKFAIADHLELMIILDWWVIFGLRPISQRQVFEAIIRKSTISNRIATHDPGLILRLLEVFPVYLSEFCPADLTHEEIAQRQSDVSPLPSQRRYRRLYEEMISDGQDLSMMIKEEEQRILPMEIKRNTLLGFLVKQLHHETCQICNLCGHTDKDPIMTVHHIIPLSEGGVDVAKNMLVVCRHHHQAIHTGEIQVRLDTLIEIRSPDRIFHIEPNQI